MQMDLHSYVRMYQSSLKQTLCNCVCMSECLVSPVLVPGSCTMEYKQRSRQNEHILTTILYGTNNLSVYTRLMYLQGVYLQPDCTKYHTLLVTILYLQPVCTYNLTVLTT